MKHSIKSIFGEYRPADASEFTQNAFLSAMLRTLPCYLSIPMAGLADPSNPPAAFLGLAMLNVAETAYLRHSQNAMRQKFNNYAKGLSLQDQSRVKPITNALNAT